MRSVEWRGGGGRVISTEDESVLHSSDWLEVRPTISGSSGTTVAILRWSLAVGEDVGGMWSLLL